ncbi:MAG: ATPase [Balneola sp.]|nr:ATPase [Balneola sp.]|tara:strand:+ start:50900 stop:51757 length:858 start_codon:yes stop_codon:yes gene_type:complete
MHSFEVIKATGEREKFKLSKLKRSLRNAGAEPHVLSMVIDHLKENGFFKDGTTTKKIYSEAYRLIKKKSKRVASRYKLKESLLELGPSGYPFEVLISEMFKKLGYSTQVGEVVQGKCVSHEVDVIAQNEEEVFMIECKFHNRQDHHSNVTIPLYVQSRFADVSEGWKQKSDLRSKKHVGYVVNNTRFTSDAIQYANCMNLKLLSWNHPEGQGLKAMLEQTQIHPITGLSSLTKKEKQRILEEKVVHCQQLLDNENLLAELRFNHSKIENVLKEAEELCSDQQNLV